MQPLLDAVVDYLPSPLDVGAIEGHKVGDEEVILTREPKSDAPLVGAWRSRSCPTRTWAS
ncbi:MAG: hypothetical protein V9E98_11520 [Candidatus Nanopelagicales bacterium]